MDPKKRLRPEQRLRKQTAFKNLVDKGIFARGTLFYVWAGLQRETLPKAKKTHPMIGIVVSRKTDPRATKRNALKRRVREIFRKHQMSLKVGSSCLVKVRQLKAEPSFSAMEEELIALFKKTGAWV